MLYEWLLYILKLSKYIHEVNFEGYYQILSFTEAIFKISLKIVRVCDVC